MTAMKIAIDQAMRTRALNAANAMGTLPNSYTGGHRNFQGFLGEELFEAYLKHKGLSFTRVNGFQYDYEVILPNGVMVTADVKAKDRVQQPAPSFDAVIINNTQQTDSYAFTQSDPRAIWGWHVGWISKADFLAHSTVPPLGHTANNGVVYSVPCRLIDYATIWSLPQIA
jgi:hypothetical protein